MNLKKKSVYHKIIRRNYVFSIYSTWLPTLTTPIYQKKKEKKIPTIVVTYAQRKISKCQHLLNSFFLKVFLTLKLLSERYLPTPNTSYVDFPLKIMYEKKEENLIILLLELNRHMTSDQHCYNVVVVVLTSIQRRFDIMYLLGNTLLHRWRESWNPLVKEQ